jgi:aldehyde dehydrogenase family 7 member A1
VHNEVIKRLKAAYEQIRIGSPFDPSTLCGPVHTKSSISLYRSTLQSVQEQGGRIIFGGEVIEAEGNFVVPTICEFDQVAEITKSEAFVPILYTMKFKVLQRLA